MESDQLKEREAQLIAEGLSPALLDSRNLQEAEPALHVTETMSGLLLETDAQIVESLDHILHLLQDPFLYALGLGLPAKERQQEKGAYQMVEVKCKYL